MARRKPISQWVNTREAILKLGMSDTTLRRRRDDGTFKRDIHYRTVGSVTAKRPTYIWHIKKCAEAMGIPVDEVS